MPMVRVRSSRAARKRREAMRVNFTASWASAVVFIDADWEPPTMPRIRAVVVTMWERRRMRRVRLGGPFASGSEALDGRVSWYIDVGLGEGRANAVLVKPRPAERRGVSATLPRIVAATMRSTLDWTVWTWTMSAEPTVLTMGGG